MTPLLFLAAAVVLAWPWIRSHALTLKAADLNVRHVAAVALLAGGLYMYTRPATNPVPTPEPPRPAGVDLRGKFRGPDAARDAAVTAALCGELADALEYDGLQEEPLIKTGVALDDLRVRARQLLCRGESLGEKHPAARDAIKAYLDQVAGTAGGPVSQQQRSAWIAAYRELSRAATNATR